MVVAAEPWTGTAKATSHINVIRKTRNMSKVYANFPTTHGSGGPKAIGAVSRCNDRAILRPTGCRLIGPRAAYRLDSVTLATLGTRVCSETTRHAPFSAHPKIDAGGTLWNFGIDPVNDRLWIYEAKPGVGHVRSQTLAVAGTPPTHDFGVTRRHLVVLLPSMTLDKAHLQAGASFGEACRCTPLVGTAAAAGVPL